MYSPWVTLTCYSTLGINDLPTLPAASEEHVFMLAVRVGRPPNSPHYGRVAVINLFQTPALLCCKFCVGQHRGIAEHIVFHAYIRIELKLISINLYIAAL